MGNITVRRAQPGDAQTISDWNRAMARETEQRELDEATILNGVQRLMQKPEYGFYLIAETSTTVAGTLMVTTEWSDWRDGLFWWIQSVYVAPSFRRQGVYRRLYDYVKQEAQHNADVCGFRLYVEKDNHIAQQTYHSLGMSETAYRLFEETNSAK